MIVGVNSKVWNDDSVFLAGAEALFSIPEKNLAPVHDSDSNIGSSREEPLMSKAIAPTIGIHSPKESEKTILLPVGKTLRLLSQDIFGDREFWVYIYLENRDKIPDPNKVSSGTELFVPDKSVYFIDAEDPRSVAKAKSIGSKILKKFVK